MRGKQFPRRGAPSIISIAAPSISRSPSVLLNIVAYPRDAASTLDVLCHPRMKRIPEVSDDDAEDPRVLPSELAGYSVRPVPELLDRSYHGSPGFVRHTLDTLRITFDTVDFDTPAARATSTIVGDRLGGFRLTCRHRSPSGGARRRTRPFSTRVGYVRTR